MFCLAQGLQFQSKYLHNIRRPTRQIVWMRSSSSTNNAELGPLGTLLKSSYFLSTKF